MANKRIIELDVTDVVENDDFLAIDSVSGKTRRIKPIKIGATYEIEDGDHSFTLVGSNGYSHTVDIPYDSVSMTQAEYNALTPAQKADGTARFLTDAESDVESELWSKVGRQTLDTEAQVLSNAVNELVDKTDETNSDVAELNSSLEIIGLSSTDIFTPASDVTMSARPCYKQGKEIFFTAVFTMSNPVSTANTLGTFKDDYKPNTQYYSIGMSYASGADAGSASLVNAGNTVLTAEHTSAKPYLVVVAKYITN